jgi:phosphatidylglycerol:prolipoprotein diacylglycerol transferase
MPDRACVAHIGIYSETEGPSLPPLLAIPFPAIDPVIVEIGPFALRWYALAYIVGIVLAWRYMRALVLNDTLWGPRNRPTPVDLDDFVLWGTLGIILGGRLGYVLFYNPAYYLANPGEILAIWSGGMSFHGGFAGTVVAMMLFAWKRGLSLWTLFDLAGCAAPIGIFFGRMANFINSELWGRPTDVPWAVVFPNAGPEPRHPSQLYEAALEGVFLFLVLRLLSHRFKFAAAARLPSRRFRLRLRHGTIHRRALSGPRCPHRIFERVPDDGNALVTPDDPCRDRVDGLVRQTNSAGS